MQDADLCDLISGVVVITATVHTVPWSLRDHSGYLWNGPPQGVNTWGVTVSLRVILEAADRIVMGGVP